MAARRCRRPPRLRSLDQNRLGQAWLRWSSCGRANGISHRQFRAAFPEDCTRADIIVTPRYAPIGCAAKIIIDREMLKETGAVTLSFKKAGRAELRAARAPDEDRPWSPAPKRRWGRAAPSSVFP